MASESGFFVVGAISWYTGSPSIVPVRVSPQNLGSNVVMALYNGTNSTKTGTASIYIIYASDAMLES